MKDINIRHKTEFHWNTSNSKHFTYQSCLNQTLFQLLISRAEAESLEEGIYGVLGSFLFEFRKNWKSKCCKNIWIEFQNNRQNSLCINKYVLICLVPPQCCMEPVLEPYYTEDVILFENTTNAEFIFNPLVRSPLVTRDLTQNHQNISKDEIDKLKREIFIKFFMYVLFISLAMIIIKFVLKILQEDPWIALKNTDTFFTYPLCAYF